METFQEALLRGNRTHRDRGPEGARRRGKVLHDRPILLPAQQPCRARSAASPGACAERAGPSQEAGPGPALPGPPAPPAAQVGPKAVPERRVPVTRWDIAHHRDSRQLPGPSLSSVLPPTRVTRHPLMPAPVLGLLLLLLLSVLLLGQSPPPTWPHLQLCYLRPPPV